jgi:hypothetical protein
MFAIRNLSVIAYAHGFTLWHYRCGAEPSEACTTDGFFSDAQNMFSKGDMVLISALGGGRVLFISSTEDGVRTAPLAG